MPLNRRRRPARRARPAGRRPDPRAPAGARRGGRRPGAARRAAPKNVTVRQQNLGQQTESTVVLKHGRPDSRASVMKAVGTPNQWVYTASDTISTVGIPGRQAWNWTSIADVPDLMSIGDFLAPRAAGSQTPPARYLLNKCQHNMKISNLGQANVKLTLFHIRNKRDVYTNMDYISPSGFTYSWNGTPTDAVRQGVQAANQGPTTGGVGYLIPGVDETESPIFNAYYSVIKKTEVLLAVGGTHKLTTNLHYDRVMDASVYGNSELSAIMGVTDYILMKAEGQTGVENDGVGPRVTIAQCQIGYTENFDYTFIQVQNAKRFLDINDNITAVGGTVTVISGSTGAGVSAVGLIS